MPEAANRFEVMPGEAAYSTPAREPKPNALRRHPKYAQIHEDLITTNLSVKEICLKYDLRTRSGLLEITRVGHYRKRMFEKYKDLFAHADEIEKQALRDEVLGKIRHVFDSAVKGHDLAKNMTKTVMSGGKNSVPITSPKPNFTAMKAQQESMTDAAVKLAEIAGVGPNQSPSFIQDNRSITTILALPKADGVPARAAKVIEAKAL
jgi:hypothetical protein